METDEHLITAVALEKIEKTRTVVFFPSDDVRCEMWDVCTRLLVVVK